MKRGSMRCPIPEHVRDVLANDVFMHSCCLYGFSPYCEGAIQWHHNFRPAGKRVNEVYSLLPLCEKHHREEAKYRTQLNVIMLARAKQFGIDIRKKYPKAIL